MDIWADKIAPALQQTARWDPYYQELSQFRAEKQQAYEQIMQKLTAEEFEVVEDYIASCEDLEYRMTQLAFLLGQIMQRRE